MLGSHAVDKQDTFFVIAPGLLWLKRLLHLLSKFVGLYGSGHSPFQTVH